MLSDERAILLVVRKAADDIHVMVRLACDMETSDEVWGFHAQQAVEKLLKAMLVRYDIRFP